MRNKIIRAIAFLLAIAIIISITACNVSNNSTDGEKRAPVDGLGIEGEDPFLGVDPVFLRNQEISNDAYNRMLRAFAEESGCHIEEYYPSYYAGAYISTDGHLIILTKNATERDFAYLNNICRIENIEYINARYSFNSNSLLRILSTADYIATGSPRFVQKCSISNRY